MSYVTTNNSVAVVLDACFDMNYYAARDRADVWCRVACIKTTNPAGFTSVTGDFFNCIMYSGSTPVNMLTVKNEDIADAFSDFALSSVSDNMYEWTSGDMSVFSGCNTLVPVNEMRVVTCKYPRVEEIDGKKCVCIIEFIGFVDLKRSGYPLVFWLETLADVSIGSEKLTPDNWQQLIYEDREQTEDFLQRLVNYGNFDHRTGEAARKPREAKYLPITL